MDVARKGDWKGGVDLNCLAAAEQRSFGWYHFYWNLSTKSAAHFDPKQLVMHLNSTETGIGLAKFPYIRDSRRATGLFGFRLNHSTAMDLWNQSSAKRNYSVGYKFADTVALGDYNFFDMHLLQNDCADQYPAYIGHAGKDGDTLVPYHIPFRSIANDEFANLLFAGKNVASTFFANSALRLHPVECNIGVAAGGTAAYMLQNGVNSTESVYAQIGALQAYLQSDAIGQPLDWS